MRKVFINECKNGNYNTVKLMLDRDKTLLCEEALTEACKYDRTDIVELLLHNNVHMPCNVLDIPCKRGYYDVVKLLLDKGVDKDYYNNYDSTMLMASENDYMDVVVLLITHGTKDFKPKEQKKKKTRIVEVLLLLILLLCAGLALTVTLI